MNCSSCGAAIEIANVFPGGSVQCTCGTKNTVPLAPARARGDVASPSPKPPAETKTSGACPRCQGPMVKRVEDEVVADVCIAGDGLFVDHDHLATLRDKGPTSTPARSLDRGKPV